MSCSPNLQPKMCFSQVADTAFSLSTQQVDNPTPSSSASQNCRHANACFMAPLYLVQQNCKHANACFTAPLSLVQLHRIAKMNTICRAGLDGSCSTGEKDMILHQVSGDSRKHVDSRYPTRRTSHHPSSRLNSRGSERVQILVRFRTWPQWSWRQLQLREP